MAWRLDDARYAATWDSGEGAFRFGGRWNSEGVRAVYASIDPALSILEVAVHKGFRMLDTERHVLTSLTVKKPIRVHVLEPEAVPNPNWLRPVPHSAGQREFGDALLATHPFVLIPSAVSSHSWNVIFDPTLVAGLYKLRSQEAFALDTRLHPPTKPNRPSVVRSRAT